MKENLVIIPTYDEIENIEAIIRKVFSLAVPFDVLVVD
ncbi:MAG: polyprenol monophosphomannose synthase, partial [Spirosomataceae bacterium]